MKDGLPESEAELNEWLQCYPPEQRKIFNEFFALIGLMKCGTLILTMDEEWQGRMKAKTIGLDYRMFEAFLRDHLKLLKMHWDWCKAEDDLVASVMEIVDDQFGWSDMDPDDGRHGEKCARRHLKDAVSKFQGVRAVIAGMEPTP